MTEPERGDSAAGTGPSTWSGSSSSIASPAAAERALAEGEVEVLGLLPRASNHALLSRIRHDDQSVLAVYKPRAGETPLWDFPDGTLCQREVAAYVVSRALGWPSVPPTVLRDGPEGVGSFQLFVRFDPRHHFFTLRGSRDEDFKRIALFDSAVNNADRKAGHCLLAEDGTIHVIDHGVCFHEEPKLRTVIWDHAGEPVPRHLRSDLEGLAERVRSSPLRAELEELLDPAEIDALEDRLSGLVRVGRFPLPGPGYPFPWPPV